MLCVCVNSRLCVEDMALNDAAKLVPVAQWRESSEAEALVERLQLGLRRACCAAVASAPTDADRASAYERAGLAAYELVQAGYGWFTHPSRPSVHMHRSTHSLVHSLLVHALVRALVGPCIGWSMHWSMHRSMHRSMHWSMHWSTGPFIGPCIGPLTPQ